MSTTILKSLGCCLFLTVVCGAPLPASQQDDAVNRRVSPAARPAATATAPAQPASLPVVRKYQVTAAEGRIMPGHIRARRGETVRITFVSRDDSYGIRFKDFGIKEKLTPEKPVVVELHPTAAGTFEFRCTRTWGVSHFSKNGTLVVE
jgi:heme/copper-type cytochrome/quinol oxidase subunit 2